LYNPYVPRRVVHISEAEAASNFADVLARVRAGAEIVIDGPEPVVIAARPSRPEPGRLLSESIALAEAHGSIVGRDKAAVLPAARPAGNAVAPAQGAASACSAAL